MECEKKYEHEYCIFDSKHYSHLYYPHKGTRHSKSTIFVVVSLR
jgi:hypothetical protein